MVHSVRLPMKVAFLVFSLTLPQSCMDGTSQKQEPETQPDPLQAIIASIDDPLLPSIRSTDIWLVKATDCLWEKKPARNGRVLGKLSIVVAQVLRGKSAVEGQALELGIWRHGPPDAPIAISGGGGGWDLFTIETDLELVLFLAPKVRDGDLWACHVGSVKVIDVKPPPEGPFSASKRRPPRAERIKVLLRDLGLIDKTMRSNDPDTVVLKALREPGTWGEEYALFLGEWAFRLEKVSPEVRLKIVEACSSAAISARCRRDLVAWIARDLKAGPDNAAGLARMCAFNLLDETVRPAIDVTLVVTLDDLLLRRNLREQVKFNAADLPRLIDVVRAVGAQQAHCAERCESLATALEEMQKKSK